MASPRPAHLYAPYESELSKDEKEKAKKLCNYAAMGKQLAIAGAVEDLQLFVPARLTLFSYVFYQLAQEQKVEGIEFFFGAVVRAIGGEAWEDVSCEALKRAAYSAARDNSLKAARALALAKTHSPTYAIEHIVSEACNRRHRDLMLTLVEEHFFPKSYVRRLSD